MADYSTLVLERLMHYHRFLTEHWKPEHEDAHAVTSSEIANALDVDPTQVRKDLGAIGLRGKGRVGFDAADTIRAIRRELGFDRTHLAILLGAGHLGGALAAYGGFAKYGVRVVAAFDRDPDKVGNEIAGCPIRHIDEMEDFIRQHQIRLAVVATPAEAAQDVVDRLAKVGVDAIWNFAPADLEVPDGVFLRTEHISLGLAEVAHYLAH